MRLIDYLIETSDDAAGKKAKIAQVRAKLKQAEEDLKDMSVTPHSEEVADAIDDARADVAKLKAELASLTEGVGYTATEAYQRHAEEAQKNLQQISQLLQAHAQRQSSNSASWGHTGDIAHVNELLKEVVDFLKGEPE